MKSKPTDSRLSGSEKALENEVNEIDSEMVKELREGLDKLEQSVPVFSPNLHWFEEQILQHRKQLRKKLVRDLLLFFTIAAIVLSLTVASMLNIPSVYTVFQIFACVLVPAALWWIQRRRKVGA